MIENLVIITSPQKEVSLAPDLCEVPTVRRLRNTREIDAYLTLLNRALKILPKIKHFPQDHYLASIIKVTVCLRLAYFFLVMTI